MSIKKCINCNEEKELNENNTCNECDEEIQEKIDEIVENATIESDCDSYSVSNEDISSSSKDSFKTTVTKRNELAATAKEQIEEQDIEDIEDTKESISTFKKIGFALALGSLALATFTIYKQKTAKKPTNSQYEDMSNES